MIWLWALGGALATAAVMRGYMLEEGAPRWFASFAAVATGYAVGGMILRIGGVL